MVKRIFELGMQRVGLLLKVRDLCTEVLALLLELTPLSKSSDRLR
jgi:hypothetical protein